MQDFDAKVKILKDFDEAHSGTYTINDLSELILDAYNLGIERVRELHASIHLPHIGDVCEWDDEPYPCTTIRTLDGETE